MFFSPPNIVDLPEFGGRFPTSSGKINRKEGARQPRATQRAAASGRPTRSSGAAAVRDEAVPQTRRLGSQMLTKGGVICQQTTLLHKLGLAFCVPDIEARVYVVIEHRNEHHHDAQRNPHANRKRRDTKQVVEERRAQNRATRAHH